MYDEFGSVFLLILVCRNRLALSRSDLGVRKKDGFLARYLDQEGNENNLDDLSEDSRKYLGDWINALYIAEALGDELTTSCSAHDFYLLVPTLLRQSMTAYQRGKLSQEPLKAGLECTTPLLQYSELTNGRSAGALLVTILGPCIVVDCQYPAARPVHGCDGATSARQVTKQR